MPKCVSCNYSYNLPGINNNECHLKEADYDSL